MAPRAVRGGRARDERLASNAVRIIEREDEAHVLDVHRHRKRETRRVDTRRQRPAVSPGYSTAHAHIVLLLLDRLTLPLVVTATWRRGRWMRRAQGVHSTRGSVEGIACDQGKRGGHGTRDVKGSMEGGRTQMDARVPTSSPRPAATSHLHSERRACMNLWHLPYRDRDPGRVRARRRSPAVHPAGRAVRTRETHAGRSAARQVDGGDGWLGWVAGVGGWGAGPSGAWCKAGLIESLRGMAGLRNPPERTSLPRHKHPLTTKFLAGIGASAAALAPGRAGRI